MNIFRETREKLGWTQRRMARELGKSLRWVTLQEVKPEIDDVVVTLAMEHLAERQEQKEKEKQRDMTDGFRVITIWEPNLTMDQLVSRITASQTAEN